MNPGTLLYVKTSEEPVVVMDPSGDEPSAPISVNRPVLTQNGTEYVAAVFRRFELETPEEQILRKLELIKLQHVLSQKAGKEVSTQIDLFGEMPPGRLQ